MNPNLSLALVFGPIASIVVLLAILWRRTAAKQRQLGAEEFRRWFQRYYLGMKPDSVPRTSTKSGRAGDVPAGSRKAS
jgi:hypothetical protein